MNLLIKIHEGEDSWWYIKRRGEMWVLWWKFNVEGRMCHTGSIWVRVKWAYELWLLFWHLKFGIMGVSILLLFFLDGEQVALIDDAMTTRRHYGVTAVATYQS